MIDKKNKPQVLAHPGLREQKGFTTASDTILINHFQAIVNLFMLNRASLVFGLPKYTYFIEGGHHE
ncbi:MAG: hypothetical protein ACOC2M_02650 [bacterium]